MLRLLEISRRKRNDRAERKAIRRDVKAQLALLDRYLAVALAPASDPRDA